jgi:antitoxin StbD
MATKIHASVIAGVTDLKRDPLATVGAGDGNPILILHRNVPVFYCVPIECFEEMRATAEKAVAQKKK